MWIAILITVVASTGNNIGKALQKSATANLPRLTLDSVVLRRYLSSKEWVTGLAADLGGGLLMIAAVARAPVSIVQPVSGLGLVLLAVFSHFYLKERLHTAEWAAVIVSTIGTIGLGATAGADPEPSDAKPLSKMRIAVVVLMFTVLVVAGISTRLQSRTKPARRATRTSAVTCGLQAGACFGLSAAACRTGFLLAQGASSALWVPVGIAFSALLTSSGFVIQTRGLKDSNTVVVCTCAAVSSMVSGVAVGLLALGEALPTTQQGRNMRLLAWLCIAVGVAMLANGQGGYKEFRSTFFGILPPPVVSRLPPKWTASFRAVHQKGELPMHVSPALQKTLSGKVSTV